MLEARVIRFMCSLQNTGWSKFPKPSTTACLIIISWFWDVKHQQLLLLTFAAQSSIIIKNHICDKRWNDDANDDVTVV